MDAMLREATEASLGADPAGGQQRPGQWFSRWSMAGAALFATSMPLAGFALLHVDPSARVHDAGLLVHLAALVIGFGAVLTVDWVGLLWAVGKRTFDDVLRTAGDVTVPIWTGYAGLVASGLCLEPDLTSALTRVKLGLVVLIGVNGLFATALHGRLVHAPNRVLVVVAGMSAGISQLGWWGALVIGHLNSR